MPRLTKRVADGLESADGKELFVWDDMVKGFGIRVSPTGRKVLLVRYRVGSRQRYFSLGPLGSPYTVETGRERARSVLRAVAEGRDPQFDKEARREAESIGSLIDRYLLEGPADKPLKRASSWETDASNLNRHVRPLIGSMAAIDATSAGIAKLRRDIEAGKTARDEKTGVRGRAIVRGGKGTASRVITVTQAMFAWAIARGDLTGPNPAKGVARAAAQKRERFLSARELVALFAALEDLEAAGALHHRHGDIIRLLVFTGARRSELANLQWEEVDFERSTIVLSPERHKTGAKTGSKRIPLAPVALSLIERQERIDDHPFVFPALRTGDVPAPTMGLDRSWRAVRSAAGLADIRLHDLRHTFVSFGVAQGESLFLVGKVLGHSNAAMTERYAHLADDPVRAVAERTASAIEDVLSAGMPRKDSTSR